MAKYKKGDILQDSAGIKAEIIMVDNNFYTFKIFYNSRITTKDRGIIDYSTDIIKVGTSNKMSYARWDTLYCKGAKYV
jgi:hypothetical protein